MTDAEREDAWTEEDRESALFIAAYWLNVSARAMQIAAARYDAVGKQAYTLLDAATRMSATMADHEQARQALNAELGYDPFALLDAPPPPVSRYRYHRAADDAPPVRWVNLGTKEE